MKMISQQRAVVLAAYRALMRTASRVSASGCPLRLVAPLKLSDFGRGRALAAHDLDAAGAALRAELFPGVVSLREAASDDDASVISAAALRRAVQREFRAGGGVAGLDGAFSHLATINRLIAASRSSSSTVTKPSAGIEVKVDVHTSFLPGRMSMSEMLDSKHFPFIYRVRIANIGESTVQVVGRHWRFSDGSGGTIEVPRGSPGVVGEAPVLRPASAFEYMSGTGIGTHSGVMSGSLQCRSYLETGQLSPLPFDALVAPVALLGPEADEFDAPPPTAEARMREPPS